MTAQSPKMATSRGGYLVSRARDYTRYMSLLGESLFAKVDLLAQVLGTVHEPSLGRYKERLLAEAISSQIPRRYEVGTGFVLFPHARRFAGERPHEFDYLNSSDFTPSRQCDIIVFDSSDYPPVFRDADLVVVRPESVRAIVEVKGTLSAKSAGEAIECIIDFGSKWRACSDFFRLGYGPNLHEPFLGVMAWRLAIDSKNRPLTSGRRIREQLVRSYGKIPREELLDLPVLDSFFLYGQFEVSSLTSTEDSWSFGFYTHRGWAIRFSETGEPQRVVDGTISSLLGGIRSHLDTPDNRFYSASDQTRSITLDPHEDEGYSPWLVGDDRALLFGEKAGTS